MAAGATAGQGGCRDHKPDYDAASPHGATLSCADGHALWHSTQVEAGPIGPELIEQVSDDAIAPPRPPPEGVTTVASHLHKIALVDEDDLSAVVDACRSLIRDRFHDDDPRGAAAMLLDDGTIVTGTSPDAINPSVDVCHETEPYCAAFRLGRSIVASVCLYREPGGRTVVLSPCGVCREQLAVHGPHVLVAVADATDPALVVWKPLKEVLPDYWMTVFPDEIDAAWTD
jgi:cytidine deaminase